MASAAYRSGGPLRDIGRGLTFRYPKPEIILSEILAPADSPSWVLDRGTLWNRVEAAEKRKDAQLAREIEFAIPLGIPRDQWADHVREYFRPMVDAGMVVDWNLHDKPGNPHVHALMTMRLVDGDGFAAKKERKWNDRTLVDQWRARWEGICNRVLDALGRPERVSRLSLAAQGIERTPQIHVGVTATAMEARGIPTERAQRNRKIKETNRERTESRRPRKSRPNPNRQPSPNRQPRTPRAADGRPRNQNASAERARRPRRRRELGATEGMAPTIREGIHPTGKTREAARDHRQGVDPKVRLDRPNSDPKPRTGMAAAIAAAASVARSVPVTPAVPGMDQHPSEPKPGLANQGVDSAPGGRPGGSSWKPPTRRSGGNTQPPNMAGIDAPSESRSRPATVPAFVGQPRINQTDGSPPSDPLEIRTDSDPDGGISLLPDGPGGGSAPLPTVPAPGPSVRGGIPDDDPMNFFSWEGEPAVQSEPQPDFDYWGGGDVDLDVEPPTLEQKPRKPKR